MNSVDNITLLLGQQIKKVRKEKGIIIEDLANAIQKSASTVSKYENGSIVMDIETFFEIANALDVKPHHLINIYPIRSTHNEDTCGHSSLQSKHTPPSRLYVYQYDGRIRRITKSLLQIMPSDNDLEKEVAFYLDVPDFSNFNQCRFFYCGKMYSYDTLIYYTLTNPFNAFGKITISTMNPYYFQHLDKNTHKFYGILTGFSFQPFTPFSSKILLSPVILKEDEDLASNLILNKDDIKNIRKYNFLMLNM